MFVAFEKETNEKIVEHDSLESLGRLVYLAGWELNDIEVFYSVKIGPHQSRGPNACLKDFHFGFNDQKELMSFDKRIKTVICLDNSPQLST